MLTPRQQASAAREISYSHGAESRTGRALIRAMENVTGRIGLIRRARGYEADVAGGRCFWEVMSERYGLSLEVISGSLSAIPRHGPLILIANHPYGVLDGLMMGRILARSRDDFRILAHSVFRRAPDLERIILPVSFEETREAVLRNVATRREAHAHLLAGGAIGIFPGGTVSTAARPFSRPLDPSWREFTARMIARSGATVVPVYFEGHTSRLFQIASHLHVTLRMGLLLQEFRRRLDRPVRVAIGEPIPPDEIVTRAQDTRALMDFLRRATYDLASDPIVPYGYGFEFDEKRRG